MPILCILIQLVIITAMIVDALNLGTLGVGVISQHVSAVMWYAVAGVYTRVKKVRSALNLAIFFIVLGFLTRLIAVL